MPLKWKVGSSNPCDGRLIIIALKFPSLKKDEKARSDQRQEHKVELHFRAVPEGDEQHRPSTHAHRNAAPFSDVVWPDEMVDGEEDSQH